MSRRLDTTRTSPDILECIANLSSDEVFTPPRVANQMLDLLPKDVWKNPDLKWLDPGCKTGVFLREIAKRLMDHLSESIPNEDARREHIYKNMLYGMPITELTSLLSRRSVYYSKDANHESYSVVRMGSKQGNIPYVETRHEFKSGVCVQCGAPESLERGETRENYAYPFIHPEQLPEELKNMKFDVIVGNPPYQVNDGGGGGGGSSASPLYQKFVEAAIDMDPKYVLMIIPSRWFAGGKGLDSFRARMLSDRRVSHLVDYLDAAQCFPGIEIKGGVNYFLWDRNHDGPCSVKEAQGVDATAPVSRNLDDYDIFVRSNKAISILEKVLAVADPRMDSQVSSRKPFGFASDFKEYCDPSIPDSISVYAWKRMANVQRSLVEVNADWIDKHKVLLGKAYGGSNRESVDIAQQVIGHPIVAAPASACTETYLVCGVYESAEEAINLAAFMKTRMARFLISLRKPSQNMSKSVFGFVPALDANIAWTDEMLFERYSITEDEILFIKSQIKEMP